jgi:hypothetical protein
LRFCLRFYWFFIFFVFIFIFLIIVIKIFFIFIIFFVFFIFVYLFIFRKFRNFRIIFFLLLLSSISNFSQPLQLLLPFLFLLLKLFLLQIFDFFEIMVIQNPFHIHRVLPILFQQIRSSDFRVNSLSHDQFLILIFIFHPPSEFLVQKFRIHVSIQIYYGFGTLVYVFVLVVCEIADVAQFLGV